MLGFGYRPFLNQNYSGLIDRWRDIKDKYFSTFQFRTGADLKVPIISALSFYSKVLIHFLGSPIYSLAMQDTRRSLLYSAANLADNRKFRSTVPVNLLKRVLVVHEKV